METRVTPMSEMLGAGMKVTGEEWRGRPVVPEGLREVWVRRARLAWKLFGGWKGLRGGEGGGGCACLRRGSVLWLLCLRRGWL